MRDIEKTNVKEETYGYILVELIQVMNSIDTNSPEAELNITTISDGNGGRILL